MKTHVHGIVTVEAVEDPAEIAESDSPLGKPFLLLKFADGTVKAVTTNLGEMIGGAASGVRLRYEDKLKGAN